MSQASRLELAGPSNPTARSEGPNDASAAGIRRAQNCGAEISALAHQGERSEQLLAVGDTQARDGTEASGDRRISNAGIGIRVVVVA